VKRVGPIDIAVVVVLLLALVMPPRELIASAAIRGDEAATFALGLAEAKTIIAPKDGAARALLLRRLEDAHQNDWALEEATRGAAVATPQTAWQVWLGLSLGYVDRLDAVEALKDAQRALEACDATACPGWERARMEIYRDHLDAGIQSGIDPKLDPRGFRTAGERHIHAAHVRGHDAIPVDHAGSASGP
jgi:hypothetical protein